MNNLNGLWPGVVLSYDGAARTCMVSIPGVADRVEAVFQNPLGDRADGPAADSTEIRILAGDPIWLMFECGDPRFPIITGYRTPREGNPVDWRRWRHANIEITADGVLLLHGGSSTIRLSDAGIVVTTPALDINEG